MPMPAWGGGKGGGQERDPLGSAAQPRPAAHSPTRAPPPGLTVCLRVGARRRGGGGAAPRQRSAAATRVQRSCGAALLRFPCGATRAKCVRRPRRCGAVRWLCRSDAAPCDARAVPPRRPRSPAAAPCPRSAPQCPRWCNARRRPCHTGDARAAPRTAPLCPRVAVPGPRWKCLKAANVPQPGWAAQPRGWGARPCLWGGRGHGPAPLSPSVGSPRPPAAPSVSVSCRRRTSNVLCPLGGGGSPLPAPPQPPPLPPPAHTSWLRGCPCGGGGGGARRDPPVLCIEPPSPRWGGRGGERLNVRRGGVRGEGGGVRAGAAELRDNHSL